MEDFSRNIFGEDNEKNSEKESDIEKKKNSSARKIGAFAKQTVDSNPRSDKTEYRWNFFGEDKKKEKSKKQKEQEAPEEPAQKTKETVDPDAEAVEKAKCAAAISYINAELEILETEVTDETQDPVHAFLTSVKERLESGETAADPVIEQEAQKRLTLAAKELDDNEERPTTTPLDIDDFTSDGEIPLDTTVDRPAVIPLQKMEAQEAKEAVASHKKSVSSPALPIEDTAPALLETDGSDMTPPRPSSPKEVPPFPFSEGKNKETHASKPAPNPAGALFVAGYMLGRRGGRKRTEARLEPQVEKLKQEVSATTRLLESKEHRLRQVASETTERKSSSASERQIPTRSEEKPAKPIERTSKKIVERAVILPEQLKSSLEIETTITSSPEERVVQPQTEQPRPQLKEEGLPKPKELPAKEQKEKSIPLPQKMKKVEQLSTPELIKEAERIYIDGASIRTLYNVNRIDRAGLMKIVQESIRGGDIAAVFKEVEIGRERQRERAKEFRHDDSHTATSSGATPPAPSQRVGHLMMQDIRLPQQQQRTHPKLHIPENERSPDLDATHQEPVPPRSNKKLTLTITAALAVFFAVAVAIIIFS